MTVVTSFHLTAELKDLSAIRHSVAQAMSKLDAAPDRVMDTLVALHEAIANTLTYGYQGQPGYLEIEVAAQGDALVIRLRDQAPPYDPTGVRPPDLALPLEQRAPGGMGIPLIRHFVDELYYRCTPAGQNELTLVKHCLQPSAYPLASPGLESKDKT